MGLQKHIYTPQTLKKHVETKQSQKVIPLFRRAQFIEELIEIKCQKRSRAKANSKLFASIGLFLSLLFVISLFEWRFYEPVTSIDAVELTSFEDEFIEVLPTQQQPPEPIVAVKQLNIIEVEDEDIIDEIDIDLDLTITENTVFEEPTAIIEDAPEEEIADEVFTIVEFKPMPKDGYQSFYKFVNDNMVYPATARRMGISGRVFVQFIVDKEGNLSDFEVVKGIGGGCDEEALRVLKMSPTWNPGKQRGEPVKVKLVIPLFFQLNKHGNR